MNKMIKTIKKARTASPVCRVVNVARTALPALLSIPTSLPLGGLGWAFASLPIGGLGWAFAFAFSLFTSSCSDWNDHYDASPSSATATTLMALLESTPQTATFAQQIRQAGYDDLLRSSQSFTVFAPEQLQTAEEGMQSSSLSPVSEQAIVTNHIARHTYPTSTPHTLDVQMLNGKIYHFSDGAFASTAITAPNLHADNGLVHRLATPIPYVNNLYEHIQTRHDLSELYAFIHQFDELKFDADNSVEIDIDTQGRPVYDSLWVSYNRLLEDPVYGLGTIAREDSAYTMLLPTNQAWQQAYERISPSFRVYDADPAVADSLQDLRTRLAIVENLIYRQSLAGADSAISTTGSIIHEPAQLLKGATELPASNGTVYVCPVLNYDNCETWDKPVLVEAEQQNVLPLRCPAGRV